MSSSNFPTQEDPWGDLRLFASEKLRQRDTYIVALVVGTLINGYGQLLVPWLRGNDAPFERFFAEYALYPGLVTFSVLIAYCFPVFVGAYSSIGTRYKRRAQERNLVRLASFPEKNPNPVIEVDLDAKVTYVNPVGRARFAELERDRREHPVLKGLDEIVAQLREGKHESLSREVEFENRTYLQNLVHLGDAELVRVYTADITALREAERNLVRLASFPEKNPNPVIEADLEGKVTYVNPLARERFPDLQQLGASHPVLEDLKAIVDELRQGRRVSYDREIRVRDFIYNQNVVYLPESGLVRLFIHDITALKELQARIERSFVELETANRELKDAQLRLIQSEKMAALGKLVAGIAHEINTPVGAIYSSHDTLRRAAEKMHVILAEDSASEEHSKKKLTSVVNILQDVSRVIRTASERVTGIVDKMRNFARLDEAELKRVDINEGLLSTIEMLRHETEGRIEVVTELGEIPPFVCYPGRLNQAFLAVMMNAFQSIKGTGRVMIRSEAREGHAIVEVRDTGCGIPAEQLESIFEPGFTTKGVGVGTGLGLSICRQTVTEHKGELLVESELDAGTTVRMSLPIRQRLSTEPGPDLSSSG